MEFAELKAQIDAARTVEVTADGIAFDLRLPHDHALRVALEATEINGVVQQAAAFRGVLERGIFGWRGATARHILHTAPAEPIAFSPDALAELLNARQDIADELTVKVVQLRKARLEKLETEEKN
jgi:hypothetical protein